MICKILSTASLRNALRYISREGAAWMSGDLIGGTADTRALAMREACLTGRRPLRHEGIHLVLSLAPGQHLSPEQWQHAVRTALRELGLAESLHEAWLHTDTGCEHVHVVATARTLARRRVDRRGERLKAKKLCRALEKEFGFPSVTNHARDAKRTRRAGPADPGVVAELRRKVGRFVGARGRDQCYTFAQLAIELRRHGVELVPKIRAGKVVGLGYRMNGTYIRAADLHKGFTFTALKKSGLDWSPERDLPVLSPGGSYVSLDPSHAGASGARSGATTFRPYDFLRGWERSLRASGVAPGRARRLARGERSPGGDRGDSGGPAPGERARTAADERPRRRRTR